MKQAPVINYFNADMPEHKTLLLLQSVEELARYIAINQVQSIFLMQDKTTGNQYFACLQQGSLIGHYTGGFNTLDDYFESKKAGFPEAALFYAAKKEGYTNYKDYQLVMEAGISDVTVFEKIKAGGFIEGYSDWKEWIKTTEALPAWEKISDPFTLYQYATAGLFNNYQDFKTAIGLGFTDANYYADATEKEFRNAADYQDSICMGLTDGKSYYFAKEHHIRDVYDFTNYLQLNKIGLEGDVHDQQLLVSVISKLPQDKKVSINKLHDLLKEALATFRYQDTNEMPQWFTKSLDNAADISKFLRTAEDTKQFGTYDSEGEYFETKHLNQRKVVLDGANVAHGNVGNDKNKPAVENIIKVVNKLKSKGFTEITVISDASLRHRLTDKERLAELEGSCEYLSAPAETTADIFLIEFVKTNGCLLVTNDTFRDWKLKDKWVAENIDYYKLSFMLDGDKVLMPDLDMMNN